jgi:hypothetical protein
MHAKSVESSHCGLSFEVHIANWPLQAEGMLNGPLNYTLDIIPIFQVVIHVKLFLRP